MAAKTFKAGKEILRNKIILVVSLSIIVPTAFFLIYIYAFVNDYFYSNYVDVTLEQTTSHLEDSVVSNLRIIENSYHVITSNQNIRENLYNHSIAEDSYYSDQLTKLNIETELKYIMSTDFAITKNLIDSVFVISDPDHYYYVLSNYLPNEPLIDSMLDFYESNEQTDDIVIQYIPDYDALYYMKPLEDHITGQHLGRVIIGINADTLAGSFGTSDQEDWHSVIFDGHEVYRFNTDPSLIGSTVDETTYRHSYLTETTELETKGGKYITLSKYISDLDYTLITYIPSAYFDKDIWQLFPNYLYFIVITVLLSTIVGIYSINHITVPLKTITKKIADVSHSDFKEKMPPYRYRELNDLSVEYNRMIDQINYLFNEVYEKQLLARDSELKALHAQINPHFIFNVLESITWEARMSENEEIEQMVTALAQLLRNNLSFTDKELFTIEQELDYISFYLYLQKVRYQDRLSYNIDLASDDLLAMSLPKFSIQTLVENAVIHGLENKEVGGHIDITLRNTKRTLIIIVSDNGCGFDARQLDLSDTTNDSHIGLKNVNQRIRLLYGNDYGITLSSLVGKGTTATITMPLDTPVSETMTLERRESHEPSNDR